jgi:hypothetical protein
MPAVNILRQELAALLNRRPRSQVAQEIGVSTQFLGMVHDGKKRPGPKVLEYLGIEEQLIYRRLNGIRRRA